MASSFGSSVVRRQHRRPGKHVFVWVWVIGICLGALVATYVIFVEPPPPRRIVIASGSRNGAYFALPRNTPRTWRRRPVRRGARDGRLGREPAPARAGRLGRGGRHRPERRGRPREFTSTVMPSAASIASHCGSSTAAKSRSIGSVSSRASASASGRAGSGTYAIAMRMLAVNGLLESVSSKGIRGPCWFRRMSTPPPEPCGRESSMPRSSSPASRPIHSVAARDPR